MDIFCRVKIFHRSSQIVFFSTTKHSKVTRMAFDCAQVLEWVLRNHCNCYLIFFLHCWTILTIRRYTRSLKLWNEEHALKITATDKMSLQSCKSSYILDFQSVFFKPSEFNSNMLYLYIFDRNGAWSWT